MHPASATPASFKCILPAIFREADERSLDGCGLELCITGLFYASAISQESRQHKPVSHFISLNISHYFQTTFHWNASQAGL